MGEEFALSTGHARFHEDALVLRNATSKVVVRLELPMIGRPHIATGNAADAFPPVLTFDSNTWPPAEVATAVKEALEDRLFLAVTGHADVRIPLTPGNVTEITNQRLGIALRASPLEDRCLYDVVLDVGGVQRRLAPHALYHRKSWENFGLAHITDMHVARRIDSFRRLLTEAGRTPDHAKTVKNWNDRFRGFVRYANWLHSQGRLDVVIATGDLYDYIYEDDDDPRGTGNALWLRRLILGEAPGPEFPDVEELRVPIYLTPGNHDYREHPYKLRFQLPLGDFIEGLLGQFSWLAKDIPNIEFDNYSGYNLEREDAQLIANKLTGRGSEPIEDESLAGAARMVAFTKNPWQYTKTLAPLGAYVVELGPHRIAMIDSAHDEGKVTKVLDLLRIKLLGLGSEDEATFVGGSPNCVGVDADALRLVTGALDVTPSDGLFFVGLHAPLFNMWGNEYPFFLRQTQRPSDKGNEQATAFLARNVPFVVSSERASLGQAAVAEQVARERYPQWFPAERDHRAPAFVSRDRTKGAVGEDIHDPLEFGVSRNHADALMERLVGEGSRRAADVVFAGHTHRHNEFSVRRTHTGEVTYFMDFYSENPTSYYATRYATGWKSTIFPTNPWLPGGHTPPQILLTPVTEVAYVEIVEGAAPDAKPEPLTGLEAFKYAINVPPYATPLASSNDPKAWWASHRPLVLQTGALGPTDTAQVSFSGFRVATVRNNVIEKISFLSSERLENAGWQLSWEEATAPAPKWAHDAAGQLVVYRDAHRDGTGDIANPYVIGFGGWQHLNHLSSGGDGTIYAVNRHGQLLFYRDQDGTGHVAGPSVIGDGGWQAMRQVFAGGEGILYAVNADGQLLFYRDTTRDGTGTIWNPQVIGSGGWQNMRRLFSGGNGIIYAVDKDGRLLRYRDHARNGTGDVSSPVVLALGAWSAFLHLFSGGDGTIYAVNARGQLLFFKDTLQDTGVDIGSPRIIGQGGWQYFHALFAGDNSKIYAVRAQGA
ncbi:MAG: tachylectin-related carbohydrate-binding protein [Kofleriaceae bacterium]